MEKNLCEVLEGNSGNYILPFLWVHGEEEQVLRNEMRRIHESLIGAVCIESRPHPDFCGTQWWNDMDIIMDEAKNLGMKVWILDDAHFPTGFANGWIKDKYPEKGKIYLVQNYIDALGPMKDASFIIDGYINQMKDNDSNFKGVKDDKLIAVIASRRTGEGEDIDDTLLDITDFVSDGTLYWDVPEGSWRVFVLIQTRNGGGRPNYINVIDAESVKVLIDAVYEPHFEHYQKDFGDTFAGFFSDEPGMGNTKGFLFDESIGRNKMALTWSLEVPELLEKELGKDYRRYLPCLWYNAGDKTTITRYKYMDIVSGLYASCFSMQLGTWCRNHGVEYIGHVIEDQNVHARLGCGAGHFFRALGGQDMSGLDVVGKQIIPGFDGLGQTYNKNKTWDGEFFHYGLAKMASSLGHIDALKKGRTMCEIFGAYGWMEGTKLMKWLVDHMLVRGVNWYVPHAFSPKEFPDADCPPHFYANGKNPQYRFFGILMGYTNRICHILSDGVHVAPAAILYHAEAEWSGEYMYFQKPAKVLAQNAIDYDIIPADIFAKADAFNTSIHGSKLAVNGEEYSCLVIPYSEYITAETARFVSDAGESGFTTIFIDRLPQGISDEKNSEVAMKLLENIQDCKTVSLDKLASLIKSAGMNEISLSNDQPFLRYYHYRKEEADFYMFFNEHPYNELSTEVEIPLTGTVSLYDAFNNTLMPLNVRIKQKENSTKFSLSLSAYESSIVVFGDIDSKCIGVSNKSIKVEEYLKEGEVTILEINSSWKLSLASAIEYPQFTYKLDLDKLINISSQKYFPRFTGTMCYETEFILDKKEGKAILDLGSVYESAEVWVNNQKVGVRICPPYKFEVEGLLKQGLNVLRIEVTNTLVKELRDRQSMSVVIEPSGLIGPVTLIK